MRYRLTIAVGIVLAAATALSGQPVYRLHDNGELWVSRVETCSGHSCVKWHLLDNHRDTREITAGGWAPSGFDSLKGPSEAPPLYQRRGNGTILRYTGKPCVAGSCPGWEVLDSNTATVSIAAAGKHLYQLHDNGSIWSWKDTGKLCRSDGSCPGWQQLDDNFRTVAILAAGIPAHTELYQRHKDGKIWRYTGQPCVHGSCPGWELLDSNDRTREITATVRVRSDGVPVQALFQRHEDGKVWYYTGTPCYEGTCPGWQLIDDNHAISIVTDTDSLYQLRHDGTIWIYADTSCSGPSCWLLLDNNPHTRQIAAGTRSLYQRHDNGAIWRYTGPQCRRDGSCPGWELLYDPTSWTIVSTQN